jgi:uncharacterized paraquat-inducible protein A
MLLHFRCVYIYYLIFSIEYPANIINIMTVIFKDVSSIILNLHFVLCLLFPISCCLLYIR